MGSYISGALSPLIWVITVVTLRITPLITTHESPSADGTTEGSPLAQAKSGSLGLLPANELIIFRATQRTVLRMFFEPRGDQLFMLELYAL